jgi:hypothetical protein
MNSAQTGFIVRRLFLAAITGHMAPPDPVESAKHHENRFARRGNIPHINGDSVVPSRQTV